MGMELRVEIAAGVVAEGGGHQAVTLDAGAFASGRIPTPGLQQLPLDEVEGGRHRLVMGADDPGRGLRGRVNQRLQRDRLRGREGDVETGAMFVFAVAQAAEAGGRAGDASGEDFLEATWA